MRVACRLLGDGPQPETLRRVERSRLQPPVVEAEPLRLAVFEKQFAVVCPGERVRDDRFHPCAVQPGAAEEQFVRFREIGHAGAPLKAARRGSGRAVLLLIPLRWRSRGALSPGASSPVRPHGRSGRPVLPRKGGRPGRGGNCIPGGTQNARKMRQ